MAWPRPAQRILLIAAALLLAASAWSLLRGPAPAAVPAPGVAAPELRLDLNGAGPAELEALPGVGPKLAARIVARRAGRGSFRSVEELAEVEGIGPAALARLRQLVTVRPGGRP